MVIADSGFWVALANPKDKHHIRANECLDALQETIDMHLTGDDVNEVNTDNEN